MNVWASSTSYNVTFLIALTFLEKFEHGGPFLLHEIKLSTALPGILIWSELKM